MCNIFDTQISHSLRRVGNYLDANCALNLRELGVKNYLDGAALKNWCFVS